MSRPNATASSLASSFALAASATESTCWAPLRSHPDDMCRCRRAALIVTCVCKCVRSLLTHQLKRRGLTCVCVCMCAGIRPAQGPQPPLRLGADLLQTMATVAAAERASRPRSAVGMPLQVALGDHTLGSSAAAVAQLCRRSGTAAHSPGPQMLCETGISADALRAPCSERCMLRRRCGATLRRCASPLAGARGLGYAERRLQLLCRCGAAALSTSCVPPPWPCTRTRTSGNA